MARANGLRRRDRNEGHRLHARGTLCLYARAAPPRGELGGRFPVQHQVGLLRAFLFGVRVPHAGRGRSGARGDRLPGGRHQPGGPHRDGAPVGCARLGRDLPRRPRLGARRSDHGERSGAGRLGPCALGAQRGLASFPDAHGPAVAAQLALSMGSARPQVERMGAWIQSGPPARPVELRRHSGRGLARADRGALHDPGPDHRRPPRVVAAPAGAARPGAEGLARLLPQARRTRPGARVVRGAAGLLDAGRPRPAGLAARDPAHRRALYRRALRRPRARREGGRAATAGARVAARMSRIVLLLAAVLALSPAALAKPPRDKPAQTYAKRPDVRAFIREMVEQHGFVERELSSLFSRAQRMEPILQAISTPAETTRAWRDYRDMLLSERRLAGGVEFWNKHREALERAEREYGVAPEYIVAIIGVETLYGRNTGRWRIIDALATLAFDYPPRADFFRQELTSYLLLARDEGINVFAVKGSYAGAFGIPQFMPGSARRFAVDFDGSGAIDLHRSPVDAVGSVANFLNRHGWQPGGEVMFEAQVQGEGYRPFADGKLEPKYPIGILLGAGVEAPGVPEELTGQLAALIELPSEGYSSEFRLGLQNFYVLTRYNRSAFYAAAVAELAKALRQAMK